jgi:RNA polymerase sigma-70 factor (ECF subfamily)
MSSRGTAVVTGRATANSDDPELLERLRAGDAAAYRQVIRRFQGPLVGVAAAITGSRSLAEEVVQDAWARSWRMLAASRDERASRAGCSAS